jgi:hypothetical protein
VEEVGATGDAMQGGGCGGTKVKVSGVKYVWFEGAQHGELLV